MAAQRSADRRRQRGRRTRSPRRTTPEVVSLRVTGRKPGVHRRHLDEQRLRRSPRAVRCINIGRPGHLRQGRRPAARSPSTAGTWSQPSKFRYQWLRQGAPIPNATGSSYKCRPTDAGKRAVRHGVRPANGFAEGAATTAPVAVATADLDGHRPCPRRPGQPQEAGQDRHHGRGARPPGPDRARSRCSTRREGAQDPDPGVSTSNGQVTLEAAQAEEGQAQDQGRLHRQRRGVRIEVEDDQALSSASDDAARHGGVVSARDLARRPLARHPRLGRECTPRVLPAPVEACCACASSTWRRA